MAIVKFLMPSLSPTMAEYGGKISKWCKRVGDRIEVGDVLLEVETDKAVMEVEVIDSGVLGAIFFEDGASGIPIGSELAVLLTDGEEVCVLDGYKPESPVHDAAAEDDLQPTKSADESSGGDEKSSSSGLHERRFASPLARAIAKERGVDLAKIGSGSGNNGRIVKNDVLAYIESTVSDNKVDVSGRTSDDKKVVASLQDDSLRSRESGTAVDNSALDVQELGPMRRVIAARLTESKSTIPHFYLKRDVNVSELLRLRKIINDSVQDKKITINDLIIKSVSKSIVDSPQVSCYWSDAGLVKCRDVDIAVAVALDDGLVTPVVRNTELKSVSAISDDVKRMAGAARSGSLQVSDMKGGILTISNLGMYNVNEFYAIINPPQSSIVAVGCARKGVVVNHLGEFVIEDIMTITLSVDHRVIDGALAAQFLDRIGFYLEKPNAILV